MNGRKMIPIRRANSIPAPRGEITYLFLKTNNSLWAKLSNGTEVAIGGGSGQLVISDTYENILALKNSMSLIPGVLYGITDYSMKYILPGTDTEVKTHSTGTMYTLALTSNSFSGRAYDPLRPQVELGYDFDDNEILYEYDYLAGDLSTSPSGDAIKVMGYGTNRVEFDRKPVGQYGGNNWLMGILSNSTGLTYQLADEGITYTLTEVGSNRRITFIDFAWDFITHDAYIEMEVGVILDTRAGWITHFKDVELNIEALFDIQTAQVRRYMATEYRNGGATGRTGYWLTIPHNTLMINTYGGSSYQLVVNTLDYVDRNILMNYAGSSNSKFDIKLTNNLCFENYVIDCEIGSGVYNGHISGSAYKSKCNGVMQSFLLPTLNYMDLHYNSTFAGIYKPLGSGSFQELTMMTGTTYAYNIVSGVVGFNINIIDETIYPGTSLRWTTFQFAQITGNHYYRTTRIYNNFSGITGSYLVDNRFFGGRYTYNNFPTIEIIKGNTISLGRTLARDVYFRYNTSLVNLVGCTLNVAGSIEYNAIQYMIGITADIVNDNNKSIANNIAYIWSQLQIYDVTNYNTVYQVSDSVFHKGFSNNTGNLSTIRIRTSKFFGQCDGNVFTLNGGLEQGHFLQTVNGNSFSYLHKFLTARCKIVGVVDTIQNLTQHDLQLTKDSPVQFFEINVDGAGTMTTSEFIF